MCQTDLFIQNSALYYTARLIKNWFYFVQVEYIKDGLGSSSDLNLIENLWALIKNKLRDCDTSSIPKLEASTQDIWNNIDSQ